MIARCAVWGILLLTLVCTGCGNSNQATAPPPATAAGTAATASGSLAVVKDSVQAGAAQLVDVRTDAEWGECHLVEATHIPMATLKSQPLREDALANLDKSQPIYIHCKKGGRAVRAAEQLRQLGYQAEALEVDFEELPEAGFTEVR